MYKVELHVVSRKAYGQNPPVLCVVGARPNYMKMAPIIRAFSSANSPIRTLLVHTGQHYDPDMNDRLFSALNLPRPDVNLGVGSGTHAGQTAEVMRRFEPIIDEHGARAVLVVGDVNSTFACALVASKRCIPVIHVEAGLRSFDRTMPEEINRVLTDQISDILYTTEKRAHFNLMREGVDEQKAIFVGNVMIDSLFANVLNAVPPEQTLVREGADPRSIERGYGVVTLHRPSNVDNPEVLGFLLETLRIASKRLPLVIALHPRTKKNIDRFGLGASLEEGSGCILLPPQGYLEMLGLMQKAKAVLTDSGGIQEETTALGVPCLTLRENTERPITITEGTNTLVGRDRDTLLSALDDIQSTGGKRGRSPELWDGKAAYRIAEHLGSWLHQQESSACTR